MRLSGLGDLVNACYAVPQNPLRPPDAPCPVAAANLWPQYLDVVSRVSAAVVMAPYWDSSPDSVGRMGWYGYGAGAGEGYYVGVPYGGGGGGGFGDGGDAWGTGPGAGADGTGVEYSSGGGAGWRVVGSNGDGPGNFGPMPAAPIPVGLGLATRADAYGSDSGAASSEGLETMPDITTCQRIQCGALSASQAGMDLVMACAQAGYVGARVCTDPLCDPYKQEMSDNGNCPPYVMPRPTPQVVPNIVATAQRASNSLPDSQVLNPRTLLGPLPQIVTPAPLPQAVPMCSGLTAWVATNPLLAMAALGLLAFGLLGKGKS